MYEQYLAGQAFLYVYGNEYFEVMFPVNRFLHLAGVETRLFAKKFYKNAKKHLQRRETCAIIFLGCGRLVQIKQAAQAAICVDAGGCRRIAERLAGFSAEYVRS